MPNEKNEKKTEDKPLEMQPEVEKRLPGGLGVEFELGPRQSLFRKADVDADHEKGITYKHGPAFDHLHELVVAVDMDEYDKAHAKKK